MGMIIRHFGYQKLECSASHFLVCIVLSDFGECVQEKKLAFLVLAPFCVKLYKMDRESSLDEKIRFLLSMKMCLLKLEKIRK